MTSPRTLAGLAAGALFALLSATPAGAAAAATAAPPAAVTPKASLAVAISPIVLPAPSLPAGVEYVGASAAAVSPGGVLAGSVTVQAAGGDEQHTLPARWWPAGPGRWIGRLLPLPAGATDGYGSTVSNRGEVAGTVSNATDYRAVGWPGSGRRPVLLGGAHSQLTAAGPDGPWAVATDGDQGSTAELVSRSGARRQVGPVGSTVIRVASASSVLVDQPTSPDGSQYQPVLWRGNRSLALPTSPQRHNPSPYGYCVSNLLPDGSVAFSGEALTGARTGRGLHRGGIPGVTLDLGAVGASNLACNGSQVLAADHTLGGTLIVTPAGLTVAALWHGASAAPIPLAPGEQYADVAALATGNRAVVVAATEQGSDYNVWSGAGGTLTPLAQPSGPGAYAAIVAYTDAGLVVANTPDSAGRPAIAIWRP